MTSTPGTSGAGTAPAQGELWGRRPDAWATIMEPLARPLYEATFAALDPLAGRQLLDVGCGAGLALQVADDRGAIVCGLDASQPLIRIAQDRLPAADLEVGDIGALPYDDATFDVVCAFNAVQYAADPAHAAAELARVTRVGGRIAIGAWGDPERCETEALFARLRSLAPLPPGTPRPLAVSLPGVIERLLHDAGLMVTDAGEAACPFVFTDHDHAWTGHTSAGPVQKVIEVAGADAVRTTLTAVLEADRKPDGELRQDNVFRYVIAAKEPSG